MLKDRNDSYHKAHDFITGFKSWRSRPTWSNSYLYEKKFTTPMSRKEWIKLDNELQLSESDDRYPRCAFNSATSTLIIQCMPTPVHETIQSGFLRAIAEAEADLPFHSQCHFMTNETMRGFGGQYSGSSKIADLAVQIINANDAMETKMIMEIGFSEKYEDLTSDVTLWLEGMSSVSLCVLVSLEEEPRYCCPVDRNIDEEEFKKLGFPDPWELKPDHFHLEGPLGPVIYKGLDNEELEDEELEDEELEDEELEDEESDDQEPDNEELKWAGNISTAFLERWKRDAKTGKAKKYGKRIDLLTARSIKFKRSDFMNTTRDDDRTISIDCERFRKLLALKMKSLAAERCQHMLEDRIKKEDDLRDKDYTDIGGRQALQTNDKQPTLTHSPTIPL